VQLVTVEEIKKLDKRILEIRDPFGTGLPALRKIFKESAEIHELAVTEIVRQYMGWKWNQK
jgi:hypothetical protein